MNDPKMTLKRPSGEEDEDDLLKMQEEFLSAKDAPAAKVQRVTREPKQDKRPSNTAGKRNSSKTPEEGIVDFTDITTDIPVLLAIKENVVESSSANEPVENKIAFPRPFKLENDHSFDAQPQKKRGHSLFAQEMKNKRSFARPSPVFIPESPVPDVVPMSQSEDGTSTSLGSEPAEMQDMEKENLAKIGAMSLQEIQQYQKQLLEQLGPDMVNFVKSLKKRNAPNVEGDAAMDVDVNKIDAKAEPKVKFKEPLTEVSTVAKEDVVAPNLLLPIAPEEASKWPHMDKIEYQKLAWMSQLPPPKPLDPNTGQTARFDFQGFLLGHDEDVPVQRGLHHHGEEPEVAGYTMEEMFHLSRSSLSSQRIIALQTLARVLYNSNLGLFDECLNTKLVPQLLDAGAVFLLRLALDDQQMDVASAALYALHNLLVSDLDEACLDFTFPCHNGHISPFLVSHEKDKTSREEAEEMPDSEIVKEDVIRGLLRMDILPRLRYILNVMKPNDRTVVKHVLNVLVRIARHSLHSAVQIMDCPQLIQVVFYHFIPVHWTPTEKTEDTAYGVPIPNALKVIRCLATAGRHIAKRLIHAFNLTSILSGYIALESRDSNTGHVKLEALRTWKILLSYGLAGEMWLDLYPVLMHHVQECQRLSPVLAEQTANLHYSALLLASLQSLLILAGSNRGKNSEFLSWQHVDSLLVLVSSLAQKWTQDFIQFGFANVTIGIGAVTAAWNFLSTFFETERLQPSVNTVKMSESARELWSKSVQPFLECTQVAHLADNLGLTSSLVSSALPGSERCADNLPFLAAAQYGGKEVTPTVKEGSLVPLFVSLSNFARVCAQMHCLSHQSIDVVLRTFSCYAKRVATSDHLRRTWFTKQEVYLLHNLAHLLTFKNLNDDSFKEDLSLYHQVALLLPALSSPAESHLTERLLADVLFHPVFFSDQSRLSTLMMTLETQEQEVLPSATGQKAEVSDGQILRHTFQGLAEIKDIYLAQVRSDHHLKHSRQLHECRYDETPSLCVDWDADKSLFAWDWPFLPIQALYQIRKKPFSEKQEGSCESSPAIVKPCLSYLHYLMWARGGFLKRTGSPGEIFVQLCTVFLINDDVFLNPEVHCVLLCLFRRFFAVHKSHHLHLETLNRPAPFLTFYQELVEHFEATSYGDALFAAIVLVPFQQRYSYLYKQMLLTEHTSAVNLLTIPISQMLIPLHEYLYPLENNVPLLQLYLQLLLSGGLARSPLLHAMAVHHLHHYIFSPQLKEKTNVFLEAITNTRNKSHVSSVLTYMCVDPNGGVQTEQHLPTERREFLHKLGFTKLDF